jgi:hypothetical protein
MPQRLTFHGSSDEDDVTIQDIHPFDFQDDWELVRGQGVQVFDPVYRLPYQAEQYRLDVDGATITFWSCEFPSGTVAIYLP